MRNGNLVFCLLLFLCVFASLRALFPADPADWGSDHVGKPVPEFVTGDECLFCHRNDVGPSWVKNRHHLTLRELEEDADAQATLKKAPGKAAEVKLVLGGKRHQRFLKPTGDYGQLALLAPDFSQWDAKQFATGCAGCHATGVDPKTHAFSAPSLDCYVCHGDATLKHSKDTTLMLLAKKRQDPPRVVMSICAQCHVRTGKSKSTGLPYPNNFVAGDNLFRDFQVDWSDEQLKKLNPADRHILANVRDVVLLGKEDVTCLSCHDIHKPSSQKHHRVAQGESCLHCHNPTGSKKIRPAFEVHSPTCQY